jgi:hypothetical protein
MKEFVFFRYIPATLQLVRTNAEIEGYKLQTKWIGL